MDTIELRLCSAYHGDINITLHPKSDDDYFDVPTGKEVVYNDNSYYFQLSGISDFPVKLYVNDEMYSIELLDKTQNSIKFKLKDCDRDMPFLQSFGAVKIEVEINDQLFVSKSISVLVSSNYINSNVTNMVDYIYKNCEDYLYEEHKFSSKTKGIKKDEIISIEAKIKIVKDILETYRSAYQYLKVNPYSKLKKAEKVDSFGKLQSISPNTINYIVRHTNELVSVNYDTGIRYNKQFYQPNKTLIEQNVYSFDVYENQVIIGFLHTVVNDVSQNIKNLQERSYNQNKTIVKDGYIDSMYQIFSKSIKKINEYTAILINLREEYKQLNYYYSKLFGISAKEVKNIPEFTTVFRSINVYRQLYQAIYSWFNCGNYDLRKDDLLLSFISTSKIYEYYCLLKMLRYLDKQDKMELINAQRYEYSVKGKFDNNTKYNNTFVFKNNDKKITIYFQPVIYGNASSINDINLYRNTTFSLKTGKNNKRGIDTYDFVYTPDYIIKIENNTCSNYLIMDAKFSKPDDIKKNQLQGLVYKYLFSLSPLNENNNILGLYIICGKESGSDRRDNIHDLAEKIKRTVKPFAEIVVMNGTDTDNYDMLSLISNNWQ